VLPAGIAALINQHSANQELIIEAGLTGNTDLAFQAFFNDPSNHLPLDDSWELFKKMLQLNREYLPAMQRRGDPPGLSSSVTFPGWVAPTHDNNRSLS
jgi:alpha-galactosidase/6-phospho-beta-glucosidase family protein